MIQITPQMRIWVAVEPVDFRKGIDGLAGLCRQQLQADPMDGALFVFRSRNGRSLMLRLHREGHLELPAPKQKPPNNAIRHRQVRTVVAVDTTPMEGSLSSLGPLEIRLVRRAEGEDLFAQLLRDHHYLGYTRPVGEHLKYLVWAGERPVACLGWGSAPLKLGLRDRFVRCSKVRPNCWGSWRPRPFRWTGCAPGFSARRPRRDTASAEGRPGKSPSRSVPDTDVDRTVATPGRVGSRCRTPNLSPASRVRTAGGERCAGRRNRPSR